MRLLNWFTTQHAYHSDILLLEEANINLPTTDFIMTYESTIFLHVLLIFGIV